MSEDAPAAEAAPTPEAPAAESGANERIRTLIAERKELAQQLEEARAKEEEAQKKAHSFYLQMDEFSLFKLRSAIYLIDFPMTFTMCCINVWSRIVPTGSTNLSDQFSREEQEQIS